MNNKKLLWTILIIVFLFAVGVIFYVAHDKQNIVPVGFEQAGTEVANSVVDTPGTTIQEEVNDVVDTLENSKKPESAPVENVVLDEPAEEGIPAPELDPALQDIQ